MGVDTQCHFVYYLAMNENKPTPTNHHIKSNTEVDALVEAHAEYHGFDNYSAAFRSIVLEWKRMKATLSASPKRKPQAEQG